MKLPELTPDAPDSGHQCTDYTSKKVKPSNSGAPFVCESLTLPPFTSH